MRLARERVEFERETPLVADGDAEIHQATTGTR
jgi:hypothetical protein